MVSVVLASPGRPQVRAVRLRRDRIVVALEHKVLVYNFADLKLLHQIETLANSKGLVAISAVADNTVLACPGLHTGQVRAGATRRDAGGGGMGRGGVGLGGVCTTDAEAVSLGQWRVGCHVNA